MSKNKQQQNKLENRLVSIYKRTNFGILDFLFSDNNLLKSEEAQFYINKMVKQDMDIIEETTRQYNELEVEKKRLTGQQKKISQLKRTIKNKEEKLAKQKKNKQKFIRSLKAEISRIESENRQLSKASKEITAYIRKMGKGIQKFYGTGQFIKPVRGWISSRFGYRKHPIFNRRIRHNGIDIAAPKGYKIRAADSGVVIVAGEKRKYKGYGKIVVINHGRKEGKLYSSFYAHQSRILVKEGEFVKKGDEIGWVGATGYATGPHLHFEIRIDGKPRDPLKYIKI